MEQNNGSPNSSKERKVKGKVEIDIQRCKGCELCTAACKETRGTPPGVQWRRVLDIETAGFAFALPPIAVGVFALKDVSLGAAMTLPFLDGKPVFDFNVSERAKPFLLSVSIFGADKI